MKLFCVEVKKAWVIQSYEIYTNKDEAIFNYQLQVKHITEHETYPDWTVTMSESNTDMKTLIWIDVLIKEICKTLTNGETKNV